jgi:hypothetical protein
MPGSLAFASPALLAAFIVLPVIWWLLRVTPPAARLVRFPAVRLLFGLDPQEETPAHTPLWLILMRLLLASILILALAHPLLDPSVALPGRGPVVLVIDDGWAAAGDWPARQHAALDLVDRAERESRSIVLLSTAPTGLAAAKPGLLRPAEARGLVQAMVPHPWATDRAEAVKALDTLPPLGAQPALWWLSDGLDGAGAADLARKLVALGPTSLLTPAEARLARVLTPGPPEATDLTVTVKRAALGSVPPAHLRALAGDGSVLGLADATFNPERGTANAEFHLPLDLVNRVERVVLAGEASAGATLLIDEQAKRRPVGIASDRPAGSGQPLLSETYYVERALGPYADLRHGPVADLIDKGLAILVLPDGGVGPAGDRLAHWIEAGGVLLRFAGPLLAEAGEDKFLPVTLRRGGRTIGGVMSWERSAKLAPFPKDSPFAGLAVPDDVVVDRQVLADPSVDLEAHTWAQLSDGTPLVTGEKRGKGWVVLVHTTANTAWSNLALSGLFVDMLRRVTQLGEGLPGGGEAMLPPWRSLDGFGRLTPPGPAVEPIAAEALASAVPGPTHPPGFYGTEDAHEALDLGPSIKSLLRLRNLPPELERAEYAAGGERDLRPDLLAAALLLGLVDLLVGWALRGQLTTRIGRAAAAILLCLVGLGSAEAADRPSADAYAAEATRVLHLAYVTTGDAEADAVSKAGLQGLDAVLTRRTAVEAGEPMAIDIERDELIFFPLIYWPVTASQPPLSPAAAERVNRYLATGGTILFDTRDQGQGPDTPERLTALLKGVRISPLVQVPTDHVLTKSFYLIQEFPGRWSGGTLWVEPAEARVNDGVSTLVIGSNDFAAAWAIDASGQPSYPVVPGGEAQREQAYRFGVNLVMYALTGNYKADQVHVPAILERLGQ